MQSTRNPECERLIRRVMSAYYSAAPLPDAACTCDQPEVRFPEVQVKPASLQGRDYLVIKEGEEVAAVYRIHTTGQLRLMKRPPQQLR